MTIDINVYTVISGASIIAAEAVANILYSPREGFDPDTIAELEAGLGPYITDRLNAALKRGATRKEGGAA